MSESRVKSRNEKIGCDESIEREEHHDVGRRKVLASEVGLLTQLYFQAAESLLQLRSLCFYKYGLRREFGERTRYPLMIPPPTARISGRARKGDSLPATTKMMYRSTRLMSEPEA